ncbi:MAG: LptF/LptG family permease [Candidatus Latescibacteria bacterium]|nr:LptF/LptG family permease [Candidatus Latescibacterota bacterium]NIO27336.1 LptF/LptG family permease [Candidatus Latescibacterota bacterium]NIO54860.1 LptF/LptG family permease [Candidatus Latescibacterota bacterium]NIT00943.1 LptF/LptG family permease [Candidatus Latescibacterota bacterium]NIT37866.1 LptF/LptG family permease [Candidatus Latescibacterota bacterium]
MIPRTHDRYVLKKFLRVFFISLLSFSVIYIVVDIFEEIDNFIDHDAKLHYILLFYFYSIPFILSYITPVSLLLAAVFSMGIMGRRNELTAFISSGISLIRVAAPILITALLVSVASVFFNDAVVTKANKEMKNIKQFEIEGRKRSDPYLKENLYYLGEGGFVYLARRYNHRTKTLYDAVVQQFNENTLVRRIDAKRCFWRIDQWIFYQGFDRSFDSNNEYVKAFEELSIRGLAEKPEDFAKEAVDEENMNFGELKEYIRKIRRSGGDIGKYLVDLYFKLSFPFAGVIFVLLGVAFASGKRKPSMATGFGLTLVISFIYYGILRVGQTLGHNGAVPPFLAAQLGNIVFLVVGSISLVRANR